MKQLTLLLCLASLPLGCQGDLNSSENNTEAPSQPGTPTSGASNTSSTSQGTLPGSTNTSGSPDGGVSTTSGDMDTPAPDMTTPMPQLPSDLGIKRMTDTQYKNSVRDLVFALAPSLEGNNQFDYQFNNTFSGLKTNPDLVERLDSPGPYNNYVRVAIFAADWLVGQGRLGTSLADGSLDQAQSKAALETWLKEKGHVFLRRPLTAEEIAYYRDDVVMHPLDEPALRELITSLLLAPQFLLRVETGKAQPQNLEQVPLTNYELASRLSYFLWQTAPDEELYQLAKDQSLQTPDVLKAQVKRMIQSPKSRDFLLKLGKTWLGIHDGDLDFRAVLASGPLRDKLDGIVEKRINEYKEWERRGKPQRGQPGFYNLDLLYKGYVGRLEAPILDDLEAFLRHIIVDQEGAVRDLFLSNAMTSTDERVSQFYGMNSPWDGQSAPPAHDDARGGILGRVAFLATTASNTRPVIRGLRIRTQMMCQEIGEPDADIVFTSPPNPPFTTREIVDYTTGEFLPNGEKNACWGCHWSTNGLGFTFSAYNVYGQKREEEIYYFNRKELGEIPQETKDKIKMRNDAFKARFLSETGETLEAIGANPNAYIPGLPDTLTAPINPVAQPRLTFNDATEVSTPKELAQMLANRDDVAHCFGKHIIDLGMDGALTSNEDRDAIRDALKTGSVIDAIEVMVTSRSFGTKAFGTQLTSGSGDSQ